MNIDLISHIAATIRRVDGTMSRTQASANKLAEAIVDDLTPVVTNQEALDRAVDALVNEGWEETAEGPHGVGTLSRDDLANIAQIVFRSLTGA